MHEHFLKYINITYPIINFPFYLHLLLLLLHQIFFFSSSHSSILSVCALWAKHTHKKKLFVQMLYTTAFPFAKPLALCTDDESRETKWKKKKKQPTTASTSERFFICVAHQQQNRFYVYMFEKGHGPWCTDGLIANRIWDAIHKISENRCIWRKVNRFRLNFFISFIRSHRSNNSKIYLQMI